MSLVSKEIFAILCNVKADNERQTHILRLTVFYKQRKIPQ